MRANLFTLRRRADGSFSAMPGIRLDFHEVRDEKGISVGTVNGLVMGPRYGHMAKRSVVIPLDFMNRPGLSNDGTFAFTGSFLAEEGGKNPRLQAFTPSDLEPEGTCYLRVQTGFDPNVRGGASVELGRMAQALGLKLGEPFKMYRHGSVALEAGPIAHQMLGLGNDATTDEAEEIWRYIGKVGALGVPPFTDIVWRMPPDNSGVIGGNIDGAMALPVNEKGVMKAVPFKDPQAARPVFEGLLPRRMAA